jgi:hypothetical protein
LEPFRKDVESGDLSSGYRKEERSMWKSEHRREADRRGLHYRSDLTNAAWALVEPLIPPTKRGGRKRSVSRRADVNAIFSVLSTGC